MTLELKRCPFCRSTDLSVAGGLNMHYVDCNTCGAQGPTGSTEDTAVAAWNDRHGIGDKPAQHSH